MTQRSKRLLVWSAAGCVVALVLGLALWRPWSRSPAASPSKAEHEEAEGTARPEAGHRSVTLSEETMRSTGVQLATAGRRRLVREAVFTGEITFHPDRVAIVGSKVSARVLRVMAGVGDKVTRGQVLATLDSGEYARARGTYISALARRDAAQSAFDRAERLRAEGINSVRDLEEARANLLTARADLEAARGTLVSLGIPPPGAGESSSATIALTSAIAGTVVKRDAIVGQTVEPTASLFTVADLSEVWVLLDVYERDLGRVAAGADAVITTTAYPDRTFSGRVAHVAEILDERTRTAKVRIVIPNADGALRPGMFCRATLRLTGVPAADAVPARDVLAVPISALQRLGDRDVVFVRTGERTFTARPVRVGERVGGFAEVLDGLREGETVATEGSLTLKAELERASFGEDDGD